ncbi:hypothetical protein [Novipirellula herctigrandis]
MEDPAVQAMVDKGIRYLEAHHLDKMKYPFEGISGGGHGEHALMGYAHMKVMHDPNNPVVQQGVRSSQRLLGMLSQTDPGGHSSKTIYAVSVAAMLLAEVDRIAYQRELKRAADFLSRRQYRNGAYGYFAGEEGDISQTQYAMLALWTLDRAGMMIDYPSVPKTIAFLGRVQDPSGGWPYLAHDPGGAGGRVKQELVSVSMAVAGGSSLLIASDILRTWGETGAKDSPNIPGFPKAVKIFREDVGNENVVRPRVPGDPILSAIKECDGYLKSNSAMPDKLASVYPYYQLYTLERYESFKEIALQVKPNPSPLWFKSGVAYLQARQDADGGWNKDAYTTMNGTTSTSFALLFLIRSTQKAIAAASSGSLAGGQGLPKDTTEITVEGSEIKGKPVAAEMTNLLKILEKDDANNIEGKSIPDNLKLATNPKERAAQLDRMERLVRGSQSWQARRVAARLLGQSDELRVVPTLIYALSDPDPMVPIYARDGLRMIARRFEGFGLSDDPAEGETDLAQKQWRAWYRKMNPGYVFLDYDL